MFVELLKDYESFKKGDVLQVVSFTDREVFIVSHESQITGGTVKIHVLAQSSCTLTSKTLPEEMCVPVSMFREMVGNLNPSSRKLSEFSLGGMSANLNYNFTSSEYHLVVVVY